MFKLFGFDVRIHGSFWFMAAILGMPRSAEPEALLRTASWVVVVTMSILVHELGHALAARRFGAEAPTIELYSLGGVTMYETDSPMRYGQRAAVSAAGPLAGFALGGATFATLALGLLPDGGFWRTVVGQLMWVNFGWGALNLLPMLPLDGGHIAEAALDSLTHGRGRRPAQVVSMVVGVAAVALAVHVRLTWAALIAGFCTWQTFNDFRRASRH
ncbi:MAG: M50 family metallopeptidase [Myxococcales bacterium]|nr:M50 family metallopeptidase [Myxococcales bacterium]